MTATFTPKRLADFCDGLEPVEVADAKNNLSGWCQNAKRLGISLRELANSSGYYLSSDVSWHLDATDWPTRPSVGTTITDLTQTIYTVLNVSVPPRVAGFEEGTHRWVCTARALEVVAGLDTLVTIQLANRSKDEAGASQVTWETETANVRAKITVTSIAISGNLNNSAANSRSAEIVFQNGVTVDQDRLIVGPDGTVWQPTQVIPARIDSLLVVLADSTPAPNQ